MNKKKIDTSGINFMVSIIIPSFLALSAYACDRRISQPGDICGKTETRTRKTHGVLNHWHRTTPGSAVVRTQLNGLAIYN